MELKVILYVVVGIGYVVYNLYKKLSVPPSSQKEQDYSDSEVNETESQREVKAPVFKSVQEIIDEINQQSRVKSEPVSAKSKQQEESILFNEGVQDGEAETAKLLKEQERLLAIANRERGGKKERTNHLDSIHLFNYDTDKKTLRKKRNINLRQAMIYDVVLNRPKY